MKHSVGTASPRTGAFSIASARAASAPIALALLLLSGCAGPSGSPNGEGPIVVTAPDDYSYLNQSNAMSRAHVHDYWAGRDSVIVVEETHQGVAQYYATGDNWATFMEFLPGDGQVVPQGTAYLVATIDVKPNPGDSISEVGLRYRPADANDMTDTQPFDGDTMRIESNNTRNDLPHQVLSSWGFWIAAKGDGYVRFTGTMTLTVEAFRGIEIPLYPGHPDQWNGASEILLLDVVDELYDAHVYTPSEMCLPLPGDAGPTLCGHSLSPADGKLVPSDASHVDVTLTVTDSTPLGLDFTYHGAETRTYTLLEPTEASGSTYLYRIPVTGNGDGPYARQSLWTFYIHGSKTLPERAIEWGTYHLVATAYKDDALGPATPAQEREARQGASAGTRDPDGEALETGTGPHERDLIVTAASDTSLTIRGEGKPVRIEVRLSNGMSRNGGIDGPGKCDGDWQDLAVIGWSYGGQRLVSVDCGVLVKGLHTVHILGGASTFNGFVRVTNATFES